MKRLAAGVIFVFSLGILVQASPALAAGQAGFGCSSPFNSVTLTQTLQLPREQDGLNAGAFTAADLEAFFAVIDHNGDGAICVQLPAGWDQNSTNRNTQFHYNFVDDNSSA